MNQHNQLAVTTEEFASLLKSIKRSNWQTVGVASAVLVVFFTIVMLASNWSLMSLIQSHRCMCGPAPMPVRPAAADAVHPVELRFDHASRVLHPSGTVCGDGNGLRVP
jgi:hypothetical protein